MTKSSTPALVLTVLVSTTALSPVAQEAMAQVGFETPVPSLTTIRLETIRSRDEDLLRDLASALQSRHPNLLAGTEILFTRVESFGTVFYRMDIQGIEGEEAARDLCRILEMEKCLVARPGASVLASPEAFSVAPDGLVDMTADPSAFGTQMSGSVESEPLPTQGEGWSGIEPVEDVLSQLPLDRPDPEDLRNPTPEPWELAIASAQADDADAPAVPPSLGAPSVASKALEGVASALQDGIASATSAPVASSPSAQDAPSLEDDAALDLDTAIEQARLGGATPPRLNVVENVEATARFLTVAQAPVVSVSIEGADGSPVPLSVSESDGAAIAALTEKVGRVPPMPSLRPQGVPPVQGEPDAGVALAAAAQADSEVPPAQVADDQTIRPRPRPTTGVFAQNQDASPALPSGAPVDTEIASLPKPVWESAPEAMLPTRNDATAARKTPAPTAPPVALEVAQAAAPLRSVPSVRPDPNAPARAGSTRAEALALALADARAARTQKVGSTLPAPLAPPVGTLPTDPQGEAQTAALPSEDAPSDAPSDSGVVVQVASADTVRPRPRPTSGVFAELAARPKDTPSETAQPQEDGSPVAVADSGAPAVAPGASDRAQAPSVSGGAPVLAFAPSAPLALAEALGDVGVAIQVPAAPSYRFQASAALADSAQPLLAFRTPRSSDVARWALGTVAFPADALAAASSPLPVPVRVAPVGLGEGLALAGVRDAQGVGTGTSPSVDAPRALALEPVESSVILASAAMEVDPSAPLEAVEFWSVATLVQETAAAPVSTPDGMRVAGQEAIPTRVAGVDVPPARAPGVSDPQIAGSLPDLGAGEPVVAMLASADTPRPRMRPTTGAFARAVAQAPLDGTQQDPAKVAALFPTIRPGSDGVEPDDGLDRPNVLADAGVVARVRADAVPLRDDVRPVDRFLEVWNVSMPLTRVDIEAARPKTWGGVEAPVASAEVTEAVFAPTARLIAGPDDAPVFQLIGASSADPQTLDEFLGVLTAPEVVFAVPPAVDFEALAKEREANEAERALLSSVQTGPAAAPPTLPALRPTLDSIAAAAAAAAGTTEEGLPDTIRATVGPDSIEMAIDTRRVVVPRKAAPVSRFAVAMTDTYALPFDLTGSGVPALQRMPTLRPAVVDGTEPVAGAVLVAAPVDTTEGEGGVSDMARFFPAAGATPPPPVPAQAPSTDQAGADLAAESTPLDPTDPALEMMERLRGGLDETLTTLEIPVETPPEEVVAAATAAAETALPEDTQTGGPDVAGVGAAPGPSRPMLELPPLEVEGRPVAEAPLADVAAVEAPPTVPVTQAPVEGGDVAPRVTAFAPPNPVPFAPPAQQAQAPALPADTAALSAPGSVGAGSPGVVSQAPNEALMVRLSYADSPEAVQVMVRSLQRSFPPALLERGRFFGKTAPASPGLYIVGIEANTQADMEGLVAYMQANGIPYVLAGQSAAPLLGGQQP
jgi:hypothetical protein